MVSVSRAAILPLGAMLKAVDLLSVFLGMKPPPPGLRGLLISSRGLSLVKVHSLSSMVMGVTRSRPCLLGRYERDVRSVKSVSYRHALVMSWDEPLFVLAHFGLSSDTFVRCVFS